ncbi:MAG: hypothetical protein Q8L95_03895 [Burkholderiales bacterium]|nr:hypothetical protein [Burkholderiales bacterium]
MITSEAVAIIFAPGPVLAGQNRIAANANNPAHYLDTTGGGNNATGTPFIAALNSDRLPSSPPPSPYNDRLIVITTAQLMPVVEMRVGREVLALLKSYRNVVGVYPDADCSDGSSGSGDNQSRISWRSSTTGGYTLPRDWGNSTPPAVPALPAWFINNYWSWFIYYARASGGFTPRVNGVPKDVVIIMSGPAEPTRPVDSPGTTNVCAVSDWAKYIDDVENRDNDDTFITPSSTAYARDRIFYCPGTPGIC